MRLAGDQPVNQTARPRGGRATEKDLAVRLGQGTRVYCAGRLAAMDQEGFAGVLSRFGAAVGTLADCEVAVIGAGLWPMAIAGSEHDRLRVLETLDTRAKRGEVTTIAERAFFDALGVATAKVGGGGDGEGAGADDGDGDGPQLFSTARLTELLGVSRERIRAWVKAGLVVPVAETHGVWQFDFRQVSIARTLCDLAGRGVSAERVRRSLALLRKFLPGLERPLERLAALDQTGQLLVRLAEGDLSELDGQLHFDFTGETAPPPAATDPSRLRIAPGPRSAADWLAQGVEQEREGFLEEAAASYRQALLAGGPDAQTSLNLANVLRSAGNKLQALERYAQAVETDPKLASAWNNMGTLLAELGKADEACGAFRRALAADPDELRAHYNLADTLDEMGRTEEAAAHWRAYVAGDPTSEHGAYARRRLHG